MTLVTATSDGSIRDRRGLILAGLALGVVVTLLADVATGPAGLPPLKILGGLFDPESLTLAERVIVFDVRIPDALIALVVGAALGLAGLELQSILHNPLASPFTLGLSGAASLGAALAIVFGLTGLGIAGDLMLPAAAFLSVLATGLAILLLSQLVGGGTGAVVLFGIALLFLCNAAVALIQYFASAEATQQIVFWTIGNLTAAGWREVGIVAAVVLLVLPYSLAFADRFTALTAGDEHAAALGLPLRRLRAFSMLRVSLLTAAAVAFVGTIGFVGLVGPHMARLLVGENQRYLMPGAVVCGALVLSLTSIGTKLIIPGLIIPAGIVTSLVGVPLLLVLVLVRRSEIDR